MQEQTPCGEKFPPELRYKRNSTRKKCAELQLVIVSGFFECDLDLVLEVATVRASE